MRWFRRDNAADSLDPPPFDPGHLDVEVIRKEVIDHVDRLLPDGIDDAIPYVLDSWIDRRIEFEVAKRLRAWARYKDELLPYLVEARAELAHDAIVDVAARRTLAEYQLARDEAVRELLGTDRLPRTLRRRELTGGDSGNNPEKVEE